MAVYFWVGGSGTWNATNTANWSLTSGGPGGAGFPIATDETRFDANSGTNSDTVTVVTGAQALSILYNAAAQVDFSGIGQSLLLHGALRIQAPPPSSVLNISEVTIRLTAPNSTALVISVVPIKDLYVINFSSPSGQTTISLGSDLTCDLFFNNQVSVAFNAYKLTCGSCRIEGSANTFPCTLGAGVIDVIPPVGITVAFTCLWSGSFAQFTDVTVNVLNAAGAVSIATEETPSQSTSFNLTVSNSNVNLANIDGGLNSLVLQSGASFNANAQFDLFGNLTINSGCTLTATSTFRRVNIEKKAGSPNVSRSIQCLAGGTWSSLGLVNNVPVATDTINISGNIGTSAIPTGTFSPGHANIGAGDMHVEALTLATGNVFSGTVITVYGGNIGAAVGSTVSGNYTINARGGSFFSANNTALSTVNIFGNVNVASGSFTASNLALVTSLGAGTTSFGARPGQTITVQNTLTLDGLSGSDNLVLESKPSFGSPVGTFFLVKPSGIVDAFFTTIIDCNASGGATFNAFQTNGCINGGGNTGWHFNPPSGFFLFF